MGWPGIRSQIAIGDALSKLHAAIALALLALLAGGCSVVPVNVSNPIPGMTKVAVAPFINLSAEMSVDGRRFAIAYYDELQKTANYEVVPIGIVETTIRENRLTLEDPADAVRLARLLDVDAVVVGAVTEYVPYYPPQMGIHINWYSSRGWIFANGDESRRGCDLPGVETRAAPGGGTVNAPVARGQSPDDDDGSDRFQPFPSTPAIRLTQANASRGGPSLESALPPVWPPDSDANSRSGSPRGTTPVPNTNNGDFCPPGPADNLRPVMSYTRFFDGASPELVHRLKCYYVRRGDMRSGGWEAYLHRSDDFLRFTAHVLVMEMLALHGGTLTTEKVFLFGK